MQDQSSTLSLCSVAECDRPIHSRGLCRAHYMRESQAGRLPRITQAHPKWSGIARICVLCRAPFIPSYRPQQYCSLICANWVKNEPRRRPAIPCGYCATPFHPTLDHNTLCCSKACITAYERKHGRSTRGRRTATHKAYVCRTCGAPLAPYHKYCGKACWPRTLKAKAKPVTRKRLNALHQHHTRPTASPIRLMVFERDNWTCRLCGTQVDRTQQWPHPQAPSIDHIIPFALGGTDDWTNLRTTHMICNWRRPKPKR
jgi:hypothetical protein